MTRQEVFEHIGKKVFYGQYLKGAMGNVLTFSDGGLRYRVLVAAASYHLGAAGSGADDNTMVQGWVLKD